VFASVMPAQALVLDSFNYDVSLTVNGAGNTASSGVLTGVTSTIPAGDVVYTLEMSADTNNSPNGISSADSVMADGKLYFSMASQTLATLELDYFDADAIAPIDLTDAGGATAFYFDIEASDLGFQTLITITSFGGGVSTASLMVVSAINSLTTLYLDFSAFVGTADLTQVVGINALISSTTAGDLTLLEVGTVPEPSTLAVLGLGLLGLGFRSRRKSA